MVEMEKSRRKKKSSSSRSSSKSDLLIPRAAVRSIPGIPTPAEHKRPLRRCSRRNVIDDDDDDYFSDEFQLDEQDDDEEFDVDKMRRRREKVRVQRRSSERVSRLGRVDSVNRRVESSSSSSSSSEEDEESDVRVVKKRRINVGEKYENGGSDVDEEFDGQVEIKRRDYYVPGTRSDNNNQVVTPLPDKKQLEFILDKLQKKDIYGVYSEPVDPEELPDYLDIIEDPMDFSTVRKKLANGSYDTLEQFESDVFLISSNAMLYNAPETIYHKQACAIKELAEKKFQRIRVQMERLEKEPKPETNVETKSVTEVETKVETRCETEVETKVETRCETEVETRCETEVEKKCEPKSDLSDKPNSLVKKQLKKAFCRGSQEPVGSDFSSGATLVTTDAYNNSSADHMCNLDRPSNNDGQVEDVHSQENSFEKTEDSQSGKGVVSKLGKRTYVVDENRRATYNISDQLMERCESIYAPFEDEKKQLIPVGLVGEYSYARSLARFTANLGPIAWTMASKRIEQVLPPGLKYGKGWIGEYEPLPDQVLVFQGRKECTSVTRLPNAASSVNNERHLENTFPDYVHLPKQLSSNSHLAPAFGSERAKQPTPRVSAAEWRSPLSRGSGGPENMMVKRVESDCLSAKKQRNSAVSQKQNLLPKDSIFPEKMVVDRAKPNSPSISNAVFQNQNLLPKDSIFREKMVVDRVIPNSPSISIQKTEPTTHTCSPCGVEMNKRRIDLDSSSIEIPLSRPYESVPMSKNNLQSLPCKQPNANKVTSEKLQNGKSTNDVVGSNQVLSSPPGFIPTHKAGIVAPFSQRSDQNLSDPVQVMKVMSEKTQKQHNGSNNAHGPSQVRPSVSSPRGDSGSHAAAAAASAWMSVGAAGFKPTTQNPAGNRSQNSADQLYNGAQMLYPQTVQSCVEYPVSATMHFQPEKKGFPFQAFLPWPIKASNEAQFPTRPAMYPHMVTNDLSRFQGQAPWQTHSSHTQQKQKQDVLPPDLNVAFQSVDSQQPDLDLQL